MERQMKKWDAANYKMEKILQIHRRRGVITDETADTEALQYVIPHAIKFRIVADLVKAMRREFILSLDDIKKKATNQTSFSTHDATRFLRKKSNFGYGVADYLASEGLIKSTSSNDHGKKSKASKIVLQFVFFRYITVYKFSINTLQYDIELLGK